MPKKQKINLAKVIASLNTPCSKCGYSIPPAERRRVDSYQIKCPKCGERFVAGPRQIDILRIEWKKERTNSVTTSWHFSTVLGQRDKFRGLKTPTDAQEEEAVKEVLRQTVGFVAELRTAPHFKLNSRSSKPAYQISSTTRRSHCVRVSPASLTHSYFAPTSSRGWVRGM